MKTEIFSQGGLDTQISVERAAEIGVYAHVDFGLF
jgi:hypothetical protein